MKYGDETILHPMVMLVGPEDASEGASASPWVSLADYRDAIIWIMVGDLAGATSAVTLDQATDSSGTGSKTLSFTKYYKNGQRLFFTGRSAANFQVDETVTGGTSGLTATVIRVSSDHLVVAPLTGGTTWTTTETLTGGTSGATASANGTGQDEDIPVEMTAGSDTFNTLAVTFKWYAIPINSSMLDVAGGFDHVQLDMGDAAASETQVCAILIPGAPRQSTYQAVSTVSTQKFA